MRVIATKRLRRSDYELSKEYTAGIVLHGWEVKSIRAGRVDLKRAYCHLRANELYLVDMHVACWMLERCDPTQERKLLLHRWELLKITAMLERKNQIVLPLKLFWERNLIKVQVVLAKRNKRYQSKAYLKDREVERELQRELSNLS